MKKFTLLATVGVFAATMATSVNAEEVIKPLVVKKLLVTAKSTQAPPVSLGLGGLGAGGASAMLIGGIITTIVVIQATSGT